MNKTLSSEHETSSLTQEWRTFRNDLRQFGSTHRNYVKKLEDLESMKASCNKQLSQFQKRLAALQKNVQASLKHAVKNSADTAELIKMNEALAEDKMYLGRIGDTLPRPIETYLRVVVGPVPLCMLDNRDKWIYKDQYEKFKLAISMTILVISLLLLLLPFFSIADYLFQFLLVWYYCALTIRESILVANGSRIRLWWRLHHFLACVNNAILLMWPHNGCYQLVRKRMFLYCFCLTCVQTLQFYYQKGLLYRLRALGESKQMDINPEGVHAWMLKGLGFLVPFLLGVYAVQLYLGHWLWTLHKSVRSCRQEWHIQALAALMVIFCTGNVITAARVLWAKFRQTVSEYEYMASRYNGFWQLLKSLDTRLHQSDLESSEQDLSFRDKKE